MRIKNLNIENFRGYQLFQMKNLGRVNLIVGANNCGKTTVLEAINILINHGNLATIWMTISSHRARHLCPEQSVFIAGALLP